jgi:hypothetical protein
MEVTVDLEQSLAMALHVTTDLVQFGRTKAMRGGESDGLKPELGCEIVPCYVDVGRFVVFPAVEMKPIRTDSKHGGH